MSYDVGLYRPTTHACPNCGHEHATGTPEDDQLFWTNYTSNCGPMWREAGLQLHEWAYDKNGVRTAETLIEPLRTAIRAMEADPAKYEAMDPDNGWGSYKTVLTWLRGILRACEEHPDARVHVSY